MTSHQTILVVDDEASVRRSLQAILDRDFSVAAFSNGRDALKFIEDHPGLVQAAFIDYAMPEMDGNAVCADLRTLDSTISLIGFSGNENALFREPLFAKLLKKHISVDHVVELATDAVCLSEQRRRR